MSYPGDTIAATGLNWQDTEIERADPKVNNTWRQSHPQTDLLVFATAAPTCRDSKSGG